MAAIPAAIVLSIAVDRLRMRDLEEATIRVVQAQINDILGRAVEEAFYGADAQTVLDRAAEESQALLDEFWSGS